MNNKRVLARMFMFCIFSCGGGNCVAAQPEETMGDEKEWASEQEVQTELAQELHFIPTVLISEILGYLARWEWHVNSHLSKKFTYAGAIDASSDGKLLAISPKNFSDGPQKLVQIWDLESDELVKSLSLVSGVESLAFVPNDSSSLAIAQEGGTIELWSIPEGHIRRVLQASRFGVDCISVSGNGESVAAMRKNGPTEMFTGDTRRLILTKYLDPYGQFTFTHDNEHMIVKNSNVYNGPANTELWSIQSEEDVTRKVAKKYDPKLVAAISPDMNYVVIKEADEKRKMNCYNIIQVETGAITNKFEIPLCDAMERLQFLPGWSCVAMTRYDINPTFYPIMAGLEVYKLNNPLRGAIIGVKSLLPGKALFSVDGDKRVLFWNFQQVQGKSDIRRGEALKKMELDH